MDKRELELEHMRARETDVLGIEHTEFISSSRRAGQQFVAWEANESALAERVTSLLTTRGVRGVEVTLSCTEAEPLLKRNMARTAQAVVDIVAAALPGIGAQMVHVTQTTAPSLAGTMVQRVTMLRRNGLSRCGHASAASQLNPSIGELQAVLNAKEGLVVDYRIACNECWLLIVADNSSLSRGIDLEGFPREHTFQTSFDQVFFFAHMRHVEKLKIIT